MSEGAAHVKISIRAEAEPAWLIQAAASASDKVAEKSPGMPIKSGDCIGGPTTGVKISVRTKDERLDVRRLAAGQRCKSVNKSAGRSVITDDAPTGISDIEPSVGSESQVSRHAGIGDKSVLEQTGRAVIAQDLPALRGIGPTTPEDVTIAIRSKGEAARGAQVAIRKASLVLSVAVEMMNIAVPKDVTCDVDFSIPAQGYSLIAFGFVSKLINESARALVKAQNGGRAVPIVGGNGEQIAAHRNRADHTK